MKNLTTNFKTNNLFSLTPYIGVIIGLYIFKNAFLSIFIYNAGLLLAVLIKKNNLQLKEIIIVKNIKLLILLTFICTLAGPFLYLLWNYIKLPNSILSVKMSEFGLIGNSKFIFLIYFSTIHPFLEEYYWRFSINSNKRILSIHEILFAFYHVLVLLFFIKSFFIIICFIVLLIIARFWRYLHNKHSENLIVLVSHAVADFSIMFFIFKLY